MIKKLIFFAISAYTISFFASHNKGSLDLSSPGSVWGSQELVKQTIRSHELDVVTHVKPLQSLILGYLGEFEYSEDVTKAIVYQNPQNYAEVFSDFGGSHIWLWDIASGQHINTFYVHDALVTLVAYSPCGNYIASAAVDNSIVIKKNQAKQLELATVTE